MTDKKGYHRRKKMLFQHRQVCLGACWQFTTAMIVKSDVTCSRPQGRQFVKAQR